MMIMMIKKVYFNNSNKQKLCGILYIPKKTPAPTIILCHGFTSSKLKKKEWADFLCKKGYLVLIFDFNGHGESQGNFADLTFTQCIDDIKSAVEFARSSGYSNDKIGIAGTSMGGHVTNAYASKYPVDAIAPVAAPFNLEDTAVFGDKKKMREWKQIGIRYFDVNVGSGISEAKKALKLNFYEDRKNYNMKKFVPRIKCPMLIIHGDKDEVVPLAHAKLYYKLVNKPKKLVIIKGAGHLFINKNDIKKILTELNKWFDRYLK